MFKLFKKKEVENNNFELNVAALLIHAAKIDEHYTEKEKEIIKKTLIELGSNKENIEKTLINAEKIETKSNQILNFTKEVKNLNNEKKMIIIESLLKIIYSDGKSDIYESNLITRLSGLLYLDRKLVGNLINKAKSNYKL
tara:strand:- start:321 stop:740 length:420 start_codon:yes stop_codon:yes gene_type:complete